MVWSLLRRGSLKAYSKVAIVRALVALRLWTHYNRQILAFARQHADHALLIFTPQDFEEDRQRRISEVINGQWSLGLRSIDFLEVYKSPWLKKTVPPWVACVTNLYLPALLVLRRLKRLHATLMQEYPRNEDRRSAVDTHHPSRRETKRFLCVISPQKFAYSETFIQAHINRLPAQVKLLHGALHGSFFPALTGDDRPLLSLFERAMVQISRNAFQVTPTRFPNAALRRYLRRERIEAVLAEYGYTGASVSGACLQAGVPLIVHFHGSDAFRERYQEKYRLGYRQMFATAAAVIAVSREMEHRLAALGAPRDKLFYNPCGADTSLFSGADPGGSEPVFLAIGRFVETKAPHLTLVAFRRVVDACPDARLIMVGDGDLWGACKQLAKALELGDAVEFLGPRPHAEVAMMMRKARGYVQHSMRGVDGNSEGTPVTV
ncbi:MAG: glycosyltransferase, partial [Acidobacteria bacterium]|nr:glycosyltransferase [Acidobacteriota bacterium]